ncbi:S53 family peptidase [Streptacidiphilus monticola]|uniref:Protease pro-enzyme activation domain-containing protein n=1 Tax=Streptacidiphilus monticola TaxID=2161674 RepID=A0ABW1G154_9ACTN
MTPRPRPHGRGRRLLPLAVTASLLLTGAAAPAALADGRSGGTTLGTPDRVTLPGTVPFWAAPQADQGVTPAKAQVTARVYLAGRNLGGLYRFARQVSDPRSGQYGHYLTSRQFRSRFAPTAHQVRAVSAWLRAAGFKVREGNGGHYLLARGDASAVQKAFATTLHSYIKDGHVYTAPAGEASVPKNLASSVLTVTGLDNAPHRAKAQNSTLPGPAAAFVNAPPFSAYYGANAASKEPKAYGLTQPWVVQGYTGKQLRGAYGLTGSGLTGKGVTVAIVDAYDSPTIGADVATYARRHGDAPYAAGQLSRLDAAQWTDTESSACDASGWYGEQTLDLEAAHAIAPDAKLLYVGAGSCADADLSDSLTRIVDGHLADIVSNSWGEPEQASDPSMDPVYNLIFASGAAQGIGFYFASGDNGDEQAQTGAKQTDMPASLAWVTAVGGTSLGIGGQDQYLFETGWGTTKAALSADGTSWTGLPGAFVAGAGGGTSGRVAQPFYQSRVVPSALAKAGGPGRNRVVPDVAAVADSNTGFLVGQTQTWPDGSVRYGEYRIGGTSLAAPVFAGIQALAQQAAGMPLGFANPELYARSGSRSFHDVTDTPFGAQVKLAEVRDDFRNQVDASGGVVTTLRGLGHDTSLQAVAGFDDVTGLGSPTGDYLKSFAH